MKLQLGVNNLNIWFNNRKAYLNTAPTPFCNWIEFRTIAQARRFAQNIINQYPDAEVEIIRYTDKHYHKTEIWTKRKN